MTRSRGWLRAAVLSCFLLPSLRAGADVPPPPDSPETKRVPVTIELDWGVFADRVTRKHVVAPGDTLRSLAATYLGNKEKWKVIADANPALAANPDRIKVGDALWIPPPRYAETPPPPAKPGSGETAPLGPWYDAFWMEMHGNTNWTLDAPASPDAIPAKYASGGSFQLLPHGIAVKFRSDLEQGQVGRPHEASSHALTAWVRGDGLVNKEDLTVRCVSRFRLTGVKDGAVVTETERLRYDAEGALVTRVWPIPPPSLEYDPYFAEQFRKSREASAAAAAGMDAPPVPTPPTTDAPPAPTFAPPSTPVPPPPPSMADPAPPAMSEAVPAAPPPPARSAPIPFTNEGGSGGTKPPISPLVLVVASLVALALIGVVVALRRGAGTPVVAPPPPSPVPPPAPASPAPPARSNEFPPGSPPPVA